MKRYLVIGLLMGISILAATSIFDIQYTTNPGRDDTYPSTFIGKLVSFEAIVTAIDYHNGGFFVSEPAGGPWRALYIRTNPNAMKIGDRILLKGTVDEYFGMTCLDDVKVISKLDSNYPVPFANLVTSGQITTPDQAEAYESTLIKIQNSTCLATIGNVNRFSINDGSGACSVSNSLLANGKAKGYRQGTLFSALNGVVCYCYGEYSVNPRNNSDVTVMVPVFNQNRSWGRIKSIYR